MAAVTQPTPLEKLDGRMRPAQGPPIAWWARSRPAHITQVSALRPRLLSFSPRPPTPSRVPGPPPPCPDPSPGLSPPVPRFPHARSPPRTLFFARWSLPFPQEDVRLALRRPGEEASPAAPGAAARLPRRSIQFTSDETRKHPVRTLTTGRGCGLPLLLGARAPALQPAPQASPASRRTRPSPKAYPRPAPNPEPAAQPPLLSA